MFLVVMVMGLAGLLMMALPAFSRHGGARGHLGARGHQLGARGGGLKGALGSRGHGGLARRANDAGIPPDVASTSLARYLPSPRAICSVLALYGAFGNALLRAGHLPFFFAALAAIVPALLVERLLVRPVWNLVFRFEGRESSPLEELILGEARAVVPFRNGRGLVSTVRDGRVVQLAARLTDADAGATVKVGDRLAIEDVDARRERVVVSVVRD